MRVELPMRPGTAASGALHLGNDANTKVRAAAELLDFFIDATGTPQFERNAPAESEYSCRRWLTINPMEMELVPNGNVLVRYTVRVPQNAPERSYQCAVGFTTQPTAEQAGHLGLRTAVRVVAAFYVIVGQPNNDGQLTRVRLEYLPDPRQPGWRAVVSIQNRGLYYFRPTGKLEVLSQAGEVLQTADFIPMPVLPRRTQDYLFPLQLEPGGRYTLRARVDLGAHEIQEGSIAVVAQKP